MDGRWRGVEGGVDASWNGVWMKARRGRVDGMDGGKDGGVDGR